MQAKLVAHECLWPAFATALTLFLLIGSVSHVVQIYMTSVRSQAACAIPSGRVSTYGEVAKALHTSSRAVGQVHSQ